MDAKSVATPLQSIERSVNGNTVIALSGRLDIDTAPELRVALLRHGGAASLLLDMTGLEFMDTGGLATLIEAQLRSRRHGGRLVLFGMAPQIAEVLSMTQVTGMFTIARDEGEAVAAER